MSSEHTVGGVTLTAEEELEFREIFNLVGSFTRIYSFVRLDWGSAISISSRCMLLFRVSLSDRDGGGSISKEELGQLMETLGIHASPDEIDMMVNEIDKNNDGEIQFEGA